MARKSSLQLIAKRAELEASGGITLATLREVALTGVDRISISTLTKDVRAVDLSVRILFSSPATMTKQRNSLIRGFNQFAGESYESTDKKHTLNAACGC